MTISKQAIAQYLANNGTQCPKCGSHELQGDEFDCDADVARQAIHCGDCGAAWNDVYRLEGIEQEQPATAPTDTERSALASLRQKGYAVIVFSPEELGNASVRDVADRCVEYGNEVIHSLSEGEDEIDDTAGSEAGDSRPAWTESDDNVSLAEGWRLSHNVGGEFDDHLMIEAEDDMGMFGNGDADAGAYAFVARMAALGSDLHQRALRLHQTQDGEA